MEEKQKKKGKGKTENGFRRKRGREERKSYFLHINVIMFDLPSKYFGLSCHFAETVVW
jgi:hypothetical protein